MRTATETFSARSGLTTADADAGRTRAAGVCDSESSDSSETDASGEPRWALPADSSEVDDMRAGVQECRNAGMQPRRMQRLLECSGPNYFFTSFTSFTR